MSQASLGYGAYSRPAEAMVVRHRLNQKEESKEEKTVGKKEVDSRHFQEARGGGLRWGS